MKQELRASRVITTIDENIMVTIAVRPHETVTYASREAPGGHYEHVGYVKDGVLVPEKNTTVSDDDKARILSNCAVLWTALLHLVGSP